MRLRRGVAATVLLCLLTPAVAAAQEERAPFALEEDVSDRVARILVKGERRAEPAAVTSVMRTRPGDVLDRAVLREDIRRIFALGFFSDVQIDATRSTTGVVLTVIVEEKPAVREVRVTGNDEISTEDLTKEIDIRPAQVLDLAAVNRNAQKLTQQYVEKGFYLAEVDYEIKTLENNEVDVVFEVTERAKVVVKEIRFLGNEKVTDAELKEAMLTKEGTFLSFLTGAGTYREDMFQRDLQAIMGVYYDVGYINARLGKAVVALSPDREFLTITLPVEEGEQFNIGKLGFSGDLIVPEEELRALLTVEPGEVFSRTKLQRDIQALTDRYQDDAYAYVNVTPLTAVDAKARTVDLTFDIEKGKKVRWERIEIVGNDKTRDKVIRRELRIYEGAYFSGTALRRSRARVTALGFFEPDPRTGQIEITTRKGSSDELIIGVVEVKERATGTFQVGAGFSSVESFIATAQIQQNNFFGWGQTASLSAQISSLRQLIQLQFIEPRFYDTDWTFAFNFFRTELDFGNFVRSATGGDVTFGYPIELPFTREDEFRVFLTYTLENVDVSLGGQTLERPRIFALSDQRDSGITSSVRVSLNWDTRNNRLFPTDGFVQSVSAERSPPWLGSERLFTRFTGVTRWYFPLPLNFVFRVQGTVGWLLEDGNEPLISERYFLGGINSLRGYTLRTVSPCTQAAARFGDPDSPTFCSQTGGTSQLVTNLELEFPIVTAVGIRGVVFYDVGNTYGQDQALFQETQYDLPLGMFHSVGFGFRWFSPIGPLRFEWGFPLTPREQDDDVLFEFTIGNSF